MSDTKANKQNITNSAPNYGAQGIFNAPVYINTQVDRQHLAFTIEALPNQYVPRPQELEAVITHMLHPDRTESMVLTPALCGAGGYGKTTLARAICHDPRIREAFDDQILWVTLGEQPGDLTVRVNGVIELLTRQRPGFGNVEDATARLSELLDGPPMLLVIDDVWSAAHLKPFLRGGPHCTRLVTTRNIDTLPLTAVLVPVDAMASAEATRLLGTGIEGADSNALQRLADRLGGWPLLLALTSAALHERVRHGQDVPIALHSIEHALTRRGVVAFDARNPTARAEAVAMTLGVSLDLLDVNQRARYHELAIFSQDVDIPLATLTMLWGTTGNLDDLDTEDLCVRLAQLSLLLRCDLSNHTIRLHGVVRAYLIRAHGAELPNLHARFLDARGIDVLRPIRMDDPYLWLFLAYHLQQAGRTDDLRLLLGNGSYLQGKITYHGTAALIADFALLPDEGELARLAQTLRLSAHILELAPRELANQVRGRLGSLSVLRVPPPEPQPCLRLVSTTLLPPGGALGSNLTRHTDSIQNCMFSPDGQIALSISRDGTLQLWDAVTGQRFHTFQSHTNILQACAFSRDGRSILYVSSDRTLRLWDVTSGQTIHTRECDTDRTEVGVVSSDGQLVMSASNGPILQGHADWVEASAFSPDGRLIVSASSDRTLRLWDVTSGQTVHILRGHAHRVRACAFSPDGQLIVSGSDDRTLRLWDVASGQTVHILQGHTNIMRACAFSPDGQLVLSASRDCTLRLWDAATGYSIHTLDGHADWVEASAFSPDGRLIVSGSDDRTLRLWDVASGQTVHTLRGHAHRVRACAFSPDGQLIVSGSDDRTLRLWDVTSGQTIHILQGHVDRVRACAFSPDGQLIVSASDDRTLRLWDVTSGQTVHILQGHTDSVWDCVFSPDGRLIVSASSDRTLRLWDVGIGCNIYTFQGHTDWVNTCAFSPGGQLIVSGSDDRTLRLWDVTSGQTVHILQGHTDWVEVGALSPDGQLVVSASDDRTLRLWDVTSGQTVHILQGHVDRVRACAFSPDEQLIVSASDDRTLRLWDVTSGQTIHILQGHTDSVWDCVFSPDGRLIVSASDDRTLRLWDVTSGQTVHTLQGHTDRVRACVFSSGGRLIASVSRDCTLRIWDVTSCTELTRWYADAPLTCCALSFNGHGVIVGDTFGNLHFLQLVR